MNNAGYGVATWNGLPAFSSYACNSTVHNDQFANYKNTDDCNKCKYCKDYKDDIGREYYAFKVVRNSENCNDDTDITAVMNEDQCDFDSTTIGQ